MTMREYYNEDCMAGMKQYPDKYFDLAIVDPPYGGGGVQSLAIMTAHALAVGLISISKTQ